MQDSAFGIPHACSAGARLTFKDDNGASDADFTSSGAAETRRPLDGERFAAMRIMRRRDHSNGTGQAGALPEIRLEGTSVTFYLDVALGRTTGRLQLRCDSDGNVWASLHAVADPHADDSRD
jgi:hypothetical protein